MRHEEATGQVDEKAMRAIENLAANVREEQNGYDTGDRVEGETEEETLRSLVGLSPAHTRKPTVGAQENEEGNNSLPSLMEASFSSLMTENTTVTMQSVLSMMKEKNIVIQRVGMFDSPSSALISALRPISRRFFIQQATATQ